MLSAGALLCAAAAFGQARESNDRDCRLCSPQAQAGVFTRQPALLENKLEQVAPGRPGETELYFLGFAGNSDEPVFANEARFAATRVASVYRSQTRSAVLASGVDELGIEPVASTGNLYRSIAGFGDRMNPEDDILFLFLTSHGWRDATLQVALDGLPLDQLHAKDLRAALDSAGIKWRIIVISACYSGSFIEPLKTTWSVIVTAAAAQNTAHGCAPDNDLTDFGRALFEETLGTGHGMLEDFRNARSIIARREKTEGVALSRPQTYVGLEMERKLRQFDAGIR